jgi:type IX secretion system PorP/SprF family membrane protein
MPIGCARCISNDALGCTKQNNYIRNTLNFYYRILSIIVFTFTPVCILAQDASFAQFFANPVYTNPAMAGTSFKGGSAAGRAQLSYFDVASADNFKHRFLSASWDQGFDKLHGAVGAQYLTNYLEAPSIIAQEARASYAYRMALDKKGTHILQGALQLGLVNQQINYSRMVFDRPTPVWYPYHPKNGDSQMPEQISYLNPAAGLFFYNPKFYVGFAVHNATMPKSSMYYNPNAVHARRFTAHAGYNFALFQGNMAVQPQGIYMRQFFTRHTQIGANVQYKILNVGAWLRQVRGPQNISDALVMNAGYQNDHFRILYSFNWVYNQLANALPSAHEISICYRWKTRQKNAVLSGILY